MKKKVRVAVIFGGRSAENEVSIHSAKNVIAALDKNKYEACLIGIDKLGGWHFGKLGLKLLSTPYPDLKSFHDNTNALASTSDRNYFPEQSDLQSIDVFFPVLHGPYGEDGTIQGLLKLVNKPFVGSGILGSAVSMDKDVMKRLLSQAKIPVAKFLVFKKQERDSLVYEKIKEELGNIFFVKPANLGSSVGVYKIYTREDFFDAIDAAFLYDTKILIEQAVNAREIECSVLGNTDPIASLPGEIIPHHEFYSYEAKYLDENGAELIIPAKLTKKQVKRIQTLAIKTFKVLECSGMARVDFFLERATGKIFVNEVNTIPGFTNISMYPQLWQVSGLSSKELIDRLITLAIEKHREESSLKVTVK